MHSCLTEPIEHLSVSISGIGNCVPRLAARPAVLLNRFESEERKTTTKHDLLFCVFYRQWVVADLYQRTTLTQLFRQLEFQDPQAASPAHNP